MFFILTEKEQLFQYFHKTLVSKRKAQLFAFAKGG